MKLWDAAMSHPFFSIFIDKVGCGWYNLEKIISRGRMI